MAPSICCEIVHANLGIRLNLIGSPQHSPARVWMGEVTAVKRLPKLSGQECLFIYQATVSHGINWVNRVHFALNRIRLGAEYTLLNFQKTSKTSPSLPAYSKGRSKEASLITMGYLFGIVSHENRRSEMNSKREFLTAFPCPRNCEF